MIGNRMENSLFNIGRSPKTSHAPSTHRLVKIQNENLGTKATRFPHDTPESEPFQLHFLPKLTMLNHYHICIFQHMKELLIRNQVFH